MLQPRKAPSLVNLNQYSPDNFPQWTGYVLRFHGGHIYVGMTQDPDQRLHQHYTKRGAWMTSKRRPLSLVELYFCQTKDQLRKWETATIREFRRKFKNSVMKANEVAPKSQRKPKKKIEPEFPSRIILLPPMPVRQP